MAAQSARITNRCLRGFRETAILVRIRLDIFLPRRDARRQSGGFAEASASNGGPSCWGPLPRPAGHEGQPVQCRAGQGLVHVAGSSSGRAKSTVCPSNARDGFPRTASWRRASPSPCRRRSGRISSKPSIRRISSTTAISQTPRSSMPRRGARGWIRSKCWRR